MPWQNSIKNQPNRPIYGIKITAWLIVASAMLGGISLTAWATRPYQLPRAIDDPLKESKSVVYDVYGKYSVRGTKVHQASLRQMFSTGVKRLTGLDDPVQAWRRFIGDDDVVALKFNEVGSQELGVDTNVAAVLLQCLYEAGFKPENFMLVGLAQLPPEAQGCRQWRYGWARQELDFGSDCDNLAAWLDEVTAIINIPSIMDDNIIGLRCVLANLSWSILKNPGRFYISKGDPFLAEIYNLPQIREKVRLNIVVGLRMLYYGGPEVQEGYIYEYGALLFSIDPVALDRVVLELLRRQRRESPIPENTSDDISVAYLQTAEAIGLGYDDLNFIEYHRIQHDRD
jgi:hypothetical protein